MAIRSPERACARANAHDDQQPQDDRKDGTSAQAESLPVELEYLRYLAHDLPLSTLAWDRRSDRICASGHPVLPAIEWTTATAVLGGEPGQDQRSGRKQQPPARARPIGGSHVSSKVAAPLTASSMSFVLARSSPPAGLPLATCAMSLSITCYPSRRTLRLRQATRHHLRAWFT